MKTIEVILIDPEEQTVQKTRIVNTLNGLYQALNCDLIEVISISDKVDIICDEEGTLKDDSIMSVLYNADGDEIAIAGKYLLASHNEEGETISVSTEDLKFIYFGWFHSRELSDKAKAYVLDQPIIIKPFQDHE